MHFLNDYKKFVEHQSTFLTFFFLIRHHGGTYCLIYTKAELVR